MELFRIHKTIPFMKYSKILNAISFISFFIAIGLLVVRGLAFSIEFTGGLVMEVNYRMPFRCRSCAWTWKKPRAVKSRS